MHEVNNTTDLTQSPSGVPSEVPCDGVTDINLPPIGGIECSDEVS